MKPAATYVYSEENNFALSINGAVSVFIQLFIK